MFIFALQHVYIEGLPGAGKTMLAEALGDAAGLSSHFCQLHRDTRVQELVGDAVVMRETQPDGSEIIRQGTEPGDVTTAEFCVFVLTYCVNLNHSLPRSHPHPHSHADHPTEPCTLILTLPLTLTGVEPGGVVTAEFCVLDDISRAPGEALNILLRLLNERKFHNTPIPLLCAVATGTVLIP
jgi:MoxR-like ATPase